MSISEIYYSKAKKDSKTSSDLRLQPCKGDINVIPTSDPIYQGEM